MLPHKSLSGQACNRTASKVPAASAPPPTLRPCTHPSSSASGTRHLVVCHAESTTVGPVTLNRPTTDVPAAANSQSAKPVDRSKGLWTRCDKCGVILYVKHLKEHQQICFSCSFHLKMSSADRIEHLIDAGTWRPLDETLSPGDPLEFADLKGYPDRIKEAQTKTGLQDGVRTGTGLLHGIPVALGVMDFNYMGGSMGSVVGEKLTRLIEYATQEGLTLLIVCSSGGARMQEGIFSLMQMAKISGALHIHQNEAKLLYITILASPTTGGVTASFGMLGDIIMAEPQAIIGFAGRRVIEQTLNEQLPDDFQTAEYLLDKGLLDLVVPRSYMKGALYEIIDLYKSAPFKKRGRVPYGVQHGIFLATEEKVRRRLREWNGHAASSNGNGNGNYHGAASASANSNGSSSNGNGNSSNGSDNSNGNSNGALHTYAQGGNGASNGDAHSPSYQELVSSVRTLLGGAGGDSAEGVDGVDVKALTADEDALLEALGLARSGKVEWLARQSALLGGSAEQDGAQYIFRRVQE